ncbi:tetratricopeptide repeat protein [Fodinibius halophilus]|uniref:Tetratricopeptide repeat protein n=1 Tax=Fodinibius halophilus TaxID=1736908 RepID=A0A6M1T7H1_9BACT|nr:tetratricopeptide repeat protein [Fodinibius halophilus]NGP87064.1 tetratricopeptide repeat protein [Fodinibius halophilus]
MNKISRDLELEQQIDAYIKGKLTEEQAEALWEKLLLHPQYIELLETELGVQSILDESASTDTSENSSEVNDETIIYSMQRSWKWIAAAASVAILVVAINFLQQDTNQSIQELALNNINISTNLSSAPVMRSQKATIAPADSLLNRGFQASLSGDVKKALQFYNKIITQYPNKSAAVKAYLNKGIIQYNAGEFKSSITAFKEVINNVKKNPVTEEKAYWYMGNAYINIEQLSKAREAIHTAYSMDGIYRQPAYRILRKLDHELGNVDFDDFEQQMKEG